jgi:hypothetical protein
MRSFFAFALLGLGLSLAQPALACDMHKGAKNSCGCKSCGEKTCGNEQAKNNTKACSCSHQHGTEKANPAETKEKPAS